MSDNDALTPAEDLKYQLQTLGSYEPEDIDNPEFEVAYETEGGMDQFATVCCVDVGNRALERIEKLEHALKAYAKYDNAKAMERDIELLYQEKLANE